MNLGDVLSRIKAYYSDDVINNLDTCKKNKEYVYARRVVSYYLKNKEYYSLTQIAKFLKIHITAISHYLKKYDDEYEYNKEFRNFADKVLKE